MKTERPAIEKVHVGRKARALKDPYSGVRLAPLDDYMLSVFICEGSVPWHRHFDEDELFLVYTGAITVDSEIGPVFLRPGEVTVVPKGVGHRSASPIRSEVLLFQPRLLADRHNGDRRLYAMADDGTLGKVNLYAAAMNLAAYVPQRVVSIGHFALNLTVCQGLSGQRVNPKHSTLLLTQQGEMKLSTEGGDLDLFVGDIVVIPREVPFTLSADKRSLLLEFSHDE